MLMLSDKQRRSALKKNIALARDMARRLLADGIEEVTLTHYADEGSFRAMRLPEEGEDFEHRQRTNAETDSPDSSTGQESEAFSACQYLETVPVVRHQSDVG